MKILSILPLMLLAATAVKAQEVVSYRGAFAPAPTRQWTESWTEFSPETVVYPQSNITITGSISSNTTWTANNVYLLDGVVYVDNNATLTIEPGTIIRGTRGNRSCLVITRGAKLMAEGTQCKPIVFTSNQAVGNRVSGDWAGVVLLGRARHNLGTENLIEGLPNTDPRNFHGGTDDNDNSGVLKYVRIEYAGDILSVTPTGNELNSLTMGSVGKGTVLDYIQCSFGLDDSFEWFGGSVDAKHIVAFKGLDDDLDTDNGYSGTVQYALCIKDPALSDISNSSGFESDNSSTGIDGLLPKTSAKFFNVTQIGAFRCASNAAGSGIVPTSFLHRRGARVRRNSDLKIQNSILMNNWRGLFVDNSISGSNPTAPTTVNYNEDSAVFRNNIIAGDFTTTWSAPGEVYNGTKSLAYENAGSRTIGTNVIYANDSINTCDLLVDPWNANPNAADFRPNAGVGAVLTNPSLLTNGSDLLPLLFLDNTLFTANESYDLLVAVQNNTATTTGTITVTVFKPSGWDVTFNPTANTINVFGGAPVVNSNWTFVDNGGSISITSKPGTIILAGGENSLGFTVTRKASTSTGTNQNVIVDIVGGGDVTPLNNGALISLSAN